MLRINLVLIALWVSSINKPADMASIARGVLRRATGGISSPAVRHRFLHNASNQNLQVFYINCMHAAFVSLLYKIRVYDSSICYTSLAYLKHD